MNLYQTRDFSDFFQDTFAFLKTNGAHFFKHFCIVNGPAILILLVLRYLWMIFYTSFFGASAGDLVMSDSLELYLNDHFGLAFLGLLLFCFLGIAASLMIFAYAPLYLKCYAKWGAEKFGSDTLIRAYKMHFKKIVYYALFCAVSAIPAFIILFIGVILLAITLVGMLAIPFLLALLVMFYMLIFMEYLEGKRSVLDCVGYAWKLLKPYFWSVVGAIGLFYYMTYILQVIVALIPMIFGNVDLLTLASKEAVSFDLSTGMLIVFLISFLLGLFLALVVQLAQGIVFYSLKEGLENHSAKQMIDQIGAGE